jgi:protein transport protein SEC23
MADFEALKDQWSDVEDRDGIRLSWNTFPSSRMVRHTRGGGGDSKG